MTRKAECPTLTSESHLLSANLLAFFLHYLSAMGNIIQELYLNIKEAQEPKLPRDATGAYQESLQKLRSWQWWLLVALSIVFLLCSESAATLLGRSYYSSGGNSMWMAALVQSAGFPILLIPLFLLNSYHAPSISALNTTANMRTSHTATKLTYLYISLGLLIAGDDFLYSQGLLYLPVSTYSLICATQLAFNALFSFFLNSQKFNPFLVNSVVLLTFSASLLAVSSNSSDAKRVSTGKYAAGFLCTLGASAVYALVLSLTEFAFEKVVMQENCTVVLKMQIYPSAVATCICIIGLFASGDWMGLKEEMGKFETGRVSYVITLASIAVAWQVAKVCSSALIFQASSLLCNVISTLALPLVPMQAVVFFNDKMNGEKIIAMLLAIWGFISYIYQHDKDKLKSNKAQTYAAEASDVASEENLFKQAF